MAAAGTVAVAAGMAAAASMAAVGSMAVAAVDTAAVAVAMAAAVAATVVVAAAAIITDDEISGADFGPRRFYIRSGVSTPSRSSAASSWRRLVAARARRDPRICASGAASTGQAA